MYDRKSVARWVMLAGVGAFAAIVFLIWTRHTDAMIAKAEFPFVDLRVSSGADGGDAMKFWYFGDLKYRLNPANWAKGGWRFLNSELGSFALIGLLIWGLFKSRNRLGRLWMLAGAVTTLVFTHLVLHHHNYYLMFSPAVAVLCAVAVERIERVDYGDSLVTASSCGIPVVAGVLLLCLVQGLVGLKFSLDSDPYPSKVSALIQANTSPSDKLLIQGGGWGGHLLFISHRHGLSIWGTEFLEKPENLKRIRELGYNKLVIVSESPMLTAVQKINPGQSDYQRVTYRSQLTDIAKPWPSVLETEDILIKDIPAESAK